MKLTERFMAKVSPEPISGCWLWTGAVDDKGYGRFFAGNKSAGGHKKAELAPRVSYKLYVSEIPDGMIVRHKCDNPACVSPQHLELGTHKDNTQDMISRGRSKFRKDYAERTHCKNGHEFSGENLVIIDGVRRCRKCRSEATKRSKEKAKNIASQHKTAQD